MLSLRQELIGKLARWMGTGMAKMVYDWSMIAVLSCIYYATAIWGFQSSFGQANVSPIWAPAGIAFGAMIFLGTSILPGIWLGAFLANVVVLIGNQGMDFNYAALLSSFIATGNTLEAVVGVALLRQWMGAR